MVRVVKQRKSYLYIQDCLEAIFVTIEKSTDKVNRYNLGTNEYCQVKNSIGWICDYLGLNPEIQFQGGERGWIGDNPFIFLDTAKIRGLGWQPKLTIQQGIVQTVKYLQANQWVLEARA